MRIAIIAKPGHPDTGVGRYTGELKRALEDLGHQVTIVNPMVPLPQRLLGFLRRWSGWDLESFFNNYPIWARYPDADIYHLASQNLATLVLFCKPPGKILITVHDLIPWELRHDDELQIYQNRLHHFFDWLALKGINRISWVITDSNYSRDVLDKAQPSHLRRILTIPLGVD